jgi:hypothetical protein
MSPQEAERRRHQSERDHRKGIKRRKKTEAEREAERAKREAERARIAQYYQNPNQVLTFVEWCLINTISEATGKRIIDSGAGPIVTELAPRRIGVTVGNNAAWQASRARGVA